MFYLFFFNMTVQLSISKTKINSKNAPFLKKSRGLFNSLRNIVTEKILSGSELYNIYPQPFDSWVTFSSVIFSIEKKYTTKGYGPTVESKHLICLN